MPALAYLPAELVLAGLGLAVFGVHPRAYPLTWAAYGAVTFLAFLGPGLRPAAVGPRPRTHHPRRQPSAGRGLGQPASPRSAWSPSPWASSASLGFRRRGIPQG